MIPLPKQAGRRGLALLLPALTALPAFAGEGDHVRLQFVGTDLMILLGAIGAGAVALLYAFALISSLLKQSPGDVKMQEVGAAIKDGALAYLKKQITAMAPFVVLLAIGLFLLEGSSPVAIGVALCFVLGVLGSYLAGYTGMVTAVNGNVRVAAAAQKSYKAALETAFRSGAVAGLVTVGIGLIGAAAILVIGGPQATKYLIGFGFGGSLAALFMRVGGGIFTKAADVGADLVGKVEAGIPEDDPRNPAVIADNVGDNVGDCAGMAADVFESYVVTLIAAIVLAAATSSLFDTATWTRLVLFALTIVGIGTIASVIGIASVKGNDDLNSDPLVPIRKGFFTAALVSLVGIGAASYFLLGAKPVTAAQLVSIRQFDRDETLFFQNLREDLAQRPRADRETIKRGIEAAKKNDPTATTAADIYRDITKLPKELVGVPQVVVQRVLDNDARLIRGYEITATDLLNTPEAKARGYKTEDLNLLNGYVSADLAAAPPIPDLRGYSRVTDPNDKSNPALLRAVTPPPFPEIAPGQPDKRTTERFLTVGQAFGSAKPGAADSLVVAEVRIQADIKANAGGAGRPPSPAQKIDQTTWVGPIFKKTIEDQVKQTLPRIKEFDKNGSVKILRQVPVTLFTGRDGGIALAVPSEVTRPGALRASFPLTYNLADIPTMQDGSKPAALGGPPPAAPPTRTIELAVAKENVAPWWGFFLCFATGTILALAIEKLTEYYVSTHKRPTREVAGVSSGGAAPMLIQGFAYGAESSAMMVVLLVAALLVPIFVFPAAIYGTAVLALFGVALVGLGLLATTGYVLAMDTFGPISDNAQGVFEMSGAGHSDEKGALAVSRLDAAGNTTKALTKGFAIATAVVAAIALFQSYIEGAQLSAQGLRLDVPEIFLGLMIGGAAPFLFSAFAINAVGRSSFQLINEVRRQFREDKGIMAGTSKPDYARCVAIVTAAAQRELLSPGILAIALPIAVGFGFSIGRETTTVNGVALNLTGVQALGGFLAGAILSGQLMAILLANSGGMWDNAKKLIEDGLFGGKGSEAHKASVICDTVGDPFKDTAGPALNPLIKVMNLVALLLAGVIVRPIGTGAQVGITMVAVALLIYAIIRSKQGSLSEELQNATGTTAAVDAASEATPGHAEKKKLTLED